ncbi:MAG: hypothetical protein ACR2PR_08185 [Pseudohongiellaceae bacterium]
MAASTNPYWRDIEKCNERIERIIARGSELPFNYNGINMLRDLKKRGPNYVMTGNQIRYFDSLRSKLWHPDYD